MNLPIIIAMCAGVLGFLFVVYLVIRVLSRDKGDETMQKISGYIYKGAMAFISREYKYISVFIIVITIAIAAGIDGFKGFTWLSYIIGAVCSMIAGFIGMQISTRSNARTAQAAKQGFNSAIRVAFPGGAVMGMSVVSIGSFAIAILYWVFAGNSVDTSVLQTATNYLAGFSMGASSVALFARVGGGIYTKAADVGADLVGKVEKNIPEDDPRNPAVVADLVGDNVGDVAGMGADLYESYVGSIISALIIAATAVTIFGTGHANIADIAAAKGIPEGEIRFSGIALAFLFAAIGIVASIIAVFFVRTGKGSNPQRALRIGTIVAAILFIIGAFLLVFLWYGKLFSPDGKTDLSIFWAVLSGIVVGMSIGFIAEYYTSGKTVRNLAQHCKTGSATNIINGFAVSMKSTVLPLILIAIAIIISFYFGGAFGIAVAAIGMLATAGITVAVDAYGPISDNAGGIAEMSHLAPEVRKVTDALDAAGNTTAAIAKGFAIGSAAMTALALFTAFTQIAMGYVSDEMKDVAGNMIINLINAKVVAGLFIGGAIPFLFAGLTMGAVGRAAHSVVDEVRYQFLNIKGLMEGTAEADYARCVDITTKGALKEMIAPGLLAILIPIVMGIILGLTALAGMLAGALVVGVPLALALANAGGAWDNAKKYIEEGNLGGKGSEAHKAGVVGDTVGDPFKDTSAPAMNILLKLMTIVSVVFVPVIAKAHDWLIKLFS